MLAIARIGEDFLKALRIRVFDHLQRLSMPFYDREKAGVVVSRMTSDIDSLSELVQMGLLMFVQNGLLLLVSVVVLGIVSPQMLGLCLIAVPGVVIASRKFQRDSNEAYLDVRDGIGATLSQLQEGISGVRVVQAFAREDVQTSRFEEHNRELYDAHMRSVKISAWYLPVIEIAGLGTTALAVGIGGWWVHQGDLTIGTVTFFVLTLSNLFEPIQQLSQLFNMVQSAGAGLQKLYALLDTDVDVPERRGAVDVPAHGAIEVAGVGFHYASDPDTPVLRGVDLRIEPGERLALVGPTGAGKSTLAKLIVRFYDPTEGSVSIGGVDLRDATLSSLRRTMVVVPQEGFLFNGTLLDNVRLARAEATDDDIVAAMASIGILDRFAVLPDGLAHRGARARQPVLGGREAARLPRPRRAGRPGDPRARRGHLLPRPRHRGDRGGGHGAALRGPHHHRDRPPPHHRGARRPGRRRRRRLAGRGRHPRRAHRRRRPLRRPLLGLGRRPTRLTAGPVVSRSRRTALRWRNATRRDGRRVATLAPWRSTPTSPPGSRTCGTPTCCSCSRVRSRGCRRRRR